MKNLSVRIDDSLHAVVSTTVHPCFYQPARSNGRLRLTATQNLSFAVICGIITNLPKYFYTLCFCDD